jgi:hypothetical protein
MSSFHAIRSLCRQHNADPWLRQILFSILSNFDQDITFNLTTLTQPYRDLIRSQAALGADALFYGFFHHSWFDLQHAYLGRLGHPRDPGLTYNMPTWAAWATPGTGIKHATSLISWATISNQPHTASGLFGTASYMTPPLASFPTPGPSF